MNHRSEWRLLERAQFFRPGRGYKPRDFTHQHSQLERVECTVATDGVEVFARGFRESTGWGWCALAP